MTGGGPEQGGGHGGQDRQAPRGGRPQGRLVLRLTHARASPVALEAAVRVARALGLELESLFVEDESLIDLAGLPFTHEISLTGRVRRPLSAEAVERQMRAMAAAMLREVSRLALAADVPLHATVVRSQPDAALAAVCESCAANEGGQVVALADPLTAGDGGVLAELFRVVPAATAGIVLVGPTAVRASGRIVVVVEDIDHLETELRVARLLMAASDERRLTLLLLALDDEEAQLMDEQARLAIGGDEATEILRARVQANAPAMIAEVIRRLVPGFVIGQFGGVVVPPDKRFRDLVRVLECPMFLVR